jgi:hypothetical protein
MEFGLLLFIYSGEPPYRYDKFPILLQLTQIRTHSGLLIRPHITSWTVADNGSMTRTIFEVSSGTIAFLGDDSSAVCREDGS